MAIKVGRYRDATTKHGWTDLFVTSSAQTAWVGSGKAVTAVRGITGYEPVANPAAGIPDRVTPRYSDVMGMPSHEADALVAAGLASYA